MKYWETMANKLSVAGSTWGYCSTVTKHVSRWIVDAYRGDGRRYIVESGDLLSAFLELEATLLWSDTPISVLSFAASQLFTQFGQK
jgi:hypothetical protein